MPTITLNGNTYNGTMQDARNNSGSARIAPQQIKKSTKKKDVILEAPNGALTLMHRGTKTEFTLAWEKIPEFTRASLETLASLSSSFVFINHDGVSYSVVVPEDGYEEDLSETVPSAGGLIKYFDCSLHVVQI